MGGIFGDKHHVMLKGSGGLLHTRLICLGDGIVAAGRRPCTARPIILKTWGYLMDPNTQSGSTHTEKMFILVNECADVIFDAVPVMMHSIDEDRIFLKVNPKWLSAMGYQTEEVVGHQFTGFLTEECRIQALSDGLPLFWEAGWVHSAAYRLSRKDGRVLLRCPGCGGHS